MSKMLGDYMNMLMKYDTKTDFLKKRTICSQINENM